MMADAVVATQWNARARQKFGSMFIASIRSSSEPPDSSDRIAGQHIQQHTVGQILDACKASKS